MAIIQYELTFSRIERNEVDRIILIKLVKSSNNGAVLRIPALDFTQQLLISIFQLFSGEVMRARNKFNIDFRWSNIIRQLKLKQFIIIYEIVVVLFCVSVT